MRCGPCGVNFKSWIKLQYHNEKVHGQAKNIANLVEGSADRQERIHFAEEKLQEEIAKLRGHSY